MFQIVERGDFAGGMAGQRQLEIIAVDTAAVIGDRDQLHAPGGQLDADRLRAGIEAVFQQFFQCGCGALNDFARGDLIDEEFG